LELLGQALCNKRAIIIPGIEYFTSKEYQVFIAPLKEKYPNAFNNTEDTPNVGEHFINIREKYSLVSSIGTHLGTEMEIDAVSDTQTIIGVITMRSNPIMGLAMIVDSLINNHEVQPMIDYVKNNLNLKLTDEQCEQLECELETIARESKNGNPIVPRCVPILLTNEHFSRILIKCSPTFGVSSILLKALGYFSLSEAIKTWYSLLASTDLRCTNH
jgi:hypothetical protein